MNLSTFDDRSCSKDVDSADVSVSVADAAAGNGEDDLLRRSRNNDRALDRSFSCFGVKDTIAKALRHRAELLATVVSLDDLLVKWREMIVWYEDKRRVCVESFRQSTELRVRLSDRLFEANALLGELSRLEEQRALVSPPSLTTSSVSSFLSDYDRFCSAPPASSLPPLPSRYFDPFVESNFSFSFSSGDSRNASESRRPPIRSSSDVRGVSALASGANFDRREEADEEDDGRTVVIGSSDSQRTFENGVSTPFPSVVSSSSLSGSSRSSFVVASSSGPCSCCERFDRSHHCCVRTRCCHRSFRCCDRLSDDERRDGDKCREDDDCFDKLDESSAVGRNGKVDDINIVAVPEEGRNCVFSVASVGVSPSSVVVGSRRDSSSLSSSLSSLSSSIVSTSLVSAVNDRPVAVARSSSLARYYRGLNDFPR